MKKIRQSLCIMAVLVLLLSMMPVAAFAEENGYEPTDAYVLNYRGEYEGPMYQYISPYKARAKVDGTEKNVQTFVFSLYNTRTKEVTAAYCTDTFVDVGENSLYRRLNLEDSTYAGSVAEKLRSIVLKGFPNTGVEELGNAAGIEGLTVDEALHAMQLAIWHVTHENQLEILNIYHAISSNSAWGGDRINPETVAHYDECHAEVLSGYASIASPNADTIRAHVEKLFNYLVNLEPTAPTGVAVSNASFIQWDETPVLSKNEDGTYNVSVEATVDVEMGDGDSLTLTAVLGSHSAGVSLPNGVSSHTLTITNVPAEVAMGDVTLAIDGMQTVSGVFLFDSTGDREVSQTMIGMDDSQLPVHAEITVEAERIINITKTSEGIPLEGIRFDIYYVADRSEYLSGKVQLPDAAEYKYSGLADYTVVTDANGFGSFSLTKNNMPDGVYLIVEKDNPAIEVPVDPFYVILPATSADGTHLEYEIDIYPKNTVYNDVEIEKDVISLGNESASVDAYKDHTWIITASIPRDISNGKRYVISDVLDNRLDFAGNLKVQVETADGTEVKETLNEGTDYILEVDDVNSLEEEKLSDSFAVMLTDTGMNKVANMVGNNFSDYKLRVYFDAQINANAGMGEQIPNQATLDYTNSVGMEFEDESDIPEVHTGGIQLIKVDDADHSHALKNAEFNIYRPATLEEIADDSITKVTLANIAAPMVQMRFFDNAALEGEKVATAASNEDGSVYIYGLAYGSYYLAETKAPAGYNLLSEPVELVVGADSHLTEKAVVVENVSGTILPETGGVGTEIFAFTGILLMLAASVLLIQKKRKAA